MTGVVIWFTGLPASGKSTLAAAVAGELLGRGMDSIALDSDDVRTALAPQLGYDEDSRAAFYTALGRLAALLARQGHIVLVAATAHRRAFRDAAREAAPAYLEVFVDTPLAECKQRDHKGVYTAALAPGVGVVYEPPLAADFHVRVGDTGAASAIASAIASARA